MGDIVGKYMVGKSKGSLEVQVDEPCRVGGKAIGAFDSGIDKQSMAPMLKGVCIISTVTGQIICPGATRLDIGELFDYR